MSKKKKKMYMYVKLPSRDLNFSPYPPHLTSTYICGVTIAPRVCGDNYDLLSFTVILQLSPN